MAIFLLRQRNGADYQPTLAYRGIYADVPADHPRALWIEALHDLVGDLQRSNCPQERQIRNFCPAAPLLRAIAAVWPADAGAAPTFVYVDLAEDQQLAQLAATFRTLGLLPLDDPNCPDLGVGARFCPAEPARRADAAVWIVRASQFAARGAAE